MKKTNLKTMFRNVVNNLLIFVAYGFTLDGIKPAIGPAKRQDEKRDYVSNGGNDRAIFRAHESLSGNDFARSSRRNRTYIGECVGPDVCYFIGTHEMYNLIREATKSAGLENVHRFVRTLTNDERGDNLVRA